MMGELDYQELCDLFTRARAGDKPSLDRLCELLYPHVSAAVHQSLAKQVRNRRPWLASLFSTSDFVQEVFIGAVREFDEIHIETAAGLVQYLATITKNQIIDAVRFHEASRRDRRRMRNEPIEELHGSREGPESEAISAEELARYHRALRCFTHRERTLLRERIENSVPYAQLFQALGYASADSARKAFHLLQAKLLARLTRVAPGA